MYLIDLHSCQSVFNFSNILAQQHFRCLLTPDIPRPPSPLSVNTTITVLLCTLYQFFEVNWSQHWRKFSEWSLTRSCRLVAPCLPQYLEHHALLYVPLSGQ
jgi:hypothetical protein